MDTSSKQSLFWRLMFIFCIYVPGMTFDAIGSSTLPTTPPSLLRKSMDDQNLPRAQLSTRATITKTTTNPPKSSTITIAFTRSSTTTAAATRINTASERKATNVRFSTGTKDSLSPSTTTNPSTKAAKEEPTTPSSSSSSSSAPPSASTSSTTTATAEVRTTAQVTIDSQWTTDDVVNNGAYKTSNNETERSIIDNKTNNIKTKNNNNNNNYAISQMMSDKSNSSISGFEQQSLLKNSLSQATVSSQKFDPLNFKQYVRQIQQDLPALNMPTNVEPSTNHSNYFVPDVYDKNIQHHEMPTNEKLMMVTTTIMASTSEVTTSFDEAPTESSKMNPATTTTAVSLPSSLTSAPVDMATNTTAATTSSSTTRTTTTTSKPLLPLAVDGYQTITSQAGTHAYLPCNVKQLVKKPISWLRVRDGHILTVDQTTFIADQRFQSIYTPNPERWSLQIKFVQTKDAGTYECQVSTEPKTSAIVTLIIVEPKTELIGEATRHVKAGSQVKLRCIISQALEPPVFINWFFNQKQIYLHNRRDWRTEIERIELSPNSPPLTAATKSGTETSSTLMLNNNVHSSMSLSVGKDRATSKLLASTETTTTTTAAPSTTTTAATDVRQITTASLIIPSVEKQDSGNYTCSPSNSAPMTVVLHVLNGEYSASAITSGINSHLIFNVNIGEKRYYHWHNATLVLVLLWLVWFLYSIKFGIERDSFVGINNNYTTYELATRNTFEEHSKPTLKRTTTLEYSKTKRRT